MCNGSIFWGCLDTSYLNFSLAIQIWIVRISFCAKIMYWKWHELCLPARIHCTLSPQHTMQLFLLIASNRHGIASNFVVRRKRCTAIATCAVTCNTSCLQRAMSNTNQAYLIGAISCAQQAMSSFLPHIRTRGNFVVFNKLLLMSKKRCLLCCGLYEHCSASLFPLFFDSPCYIVVAFE
jgi:hypothetical protein